MKRMGLIGVMAIACASTSVTFAKVPPPAPDITAPMTYDGAVKTIQGRIAQVTPYVPDKDNRPFFRLQPQGHKTPRSILMIHGLTDSPFYMLELADTFSKAGYNVVGILLPGHGTNPNDLRNVTLSQWRHETDFGLAVAAGLGDRVSIAGFSTGGALALDAIRRNAAGSSHIEIQDVFLFSPAMRLQDGLARNFCDTPVELGRQIIVGPWAETNPPDGNPHHYTWMAANGVCRLQTLINDNNSDILGRPPWAWDMVRADIVSQHIGVFAVESGADATVMPQSVVNFMNALPPGTREHLTLYPKSESIAHENVTRKETNPHFTKQLEPCILDFIGGKSCPPEPAPGFATSRRIQLQQSPALGSLPSFDGQP